MHAVPVCCAALPTVGGTTVSAPNVDEEVRYLRDRVRRLESVVEEMRGLMLATAGPQALTATVPATLAAPPPQTPVTALV